MWVFPVLCVCFGYWCCGLETKEDFQWTLRNCYIVDLCFKLRDLKVSDSCFSTLSKDCYIEECCWYWMILVWLILRGKCMHNTCVYYYQETEESACTTPVCITIRKHTLHIITTQHLAHHSFASFKFVLCVHYELCVCFYALYHLRISFVFFC